MRRNALCFIVCRSARQKIGDILRNICMSYPQLVVVA